MIMQRAINNLGIAGKLVLGFGAVLLLTLAVAGIGLGVVHTLGQRFAVLNQMSLLNRTILQTRRAEKDFALLGQASSATEVQHSVDSMLGDIKALSGEVSPQQAEQLAAAGSALNSYRQAFADYVQADAKQRHSVDDAQKYTDTMTQSLNKLVGYLLEDAGIAFEQSGGKSGKNLLEMAGKMGDLSDSLERSLIKSLAMQRGTTPTDNELIGQTAVKLKDLIDHFTDPVYTDQFTDSIAQVRSFRAALDAYRQGLTEQATLYQHMNELADQAMQRIDAAYVDYQLALDAQLRSLAWSIVIAAALALLIGAGAALGIGLAIVRPLRRVIGSARRIASGDLSETHQSGSRDEVGQLQTAMGEMSQSLRALLGQLQVGVVQLADSAQALATTARQSDEDVQQQILDTDQVATAMNEMTASVQEVARNAESAASSAMEADQRSGVGQQVVRQSHQRVDVLVESMDTAMHSMHELSRNSANIGSVVGVIKTLADQTNLLALNAAIEAARAGEQGRGFAVVADEVRALASRTQQSTTEIEALIRVLLASTAHSETCINDSRSLLGETRGDSQRTVESLDAIVGAVALIHEMNQQIASAAEEQRAVAEDINRNVVRIRDVTGKTADTIGTTAASSRTLNDLSHTLREAVGRFRL